MGDQSPVQPSSTSEPFIADPDEEHAASPQQEQPGGIRALLSTGVGTLAGLGTGAISLGLIGAIMGIIGGVLFGWDWYYQTFLAEMFASGQGSGVFLLFLIPLFLITMLVAVVAGGLLGGAGGVLLGALLGMLAGSSLGWGLATLTGRADRMPQSGTPGAGSSKLWAVLMVLGGGLVLSGMLAALLLVFLFGVGIFGEMSGSTASDERAPTAQAPANHEAAMVPRETPRAGARAYIHPDEAFALNVPEDLDNTTMEIESAGEVASYTVTAFAHQQWPTYLFVMVRPASGQMSAAEMDEELQAMFVTLRAATDATSGGTCEPEEAESYYDDWQRTCAFSFGYEGGDFEHENARGYIRQDGDTVSLLLLIGDRGLERRELGDMLDSFTPALTL
jgi:hypothetical protein